MYARLPLDLRLHILRYTDAISVVRMCLADRDLWKLARSSRRRCRRFWKTCDQLLDTIQRFPVQLDYFHVVVCGEPWKVMFDGNFCVNGRWRMHIRQLDKMLRFVSLGATGFAYRGLSWAAPMFQLDCRQQHLLQPVEGRRERIRDLLQFVRTVPGGFVFASGPNGWKAEPAGDGDFSLTVDRVRCMFSMPCCVQAAMFGQVDRIGLYMDGLSRPTLQYDAKDGFNIKPGRYSFA